MASPRHALFRFFRSSSRFCPFRSNTQAFRMRTETVSPNTSSQASCRPLTKGTLRTASRQSLAAPFPKHSSPRRSRGTPKGRKPYSTCLRRSSSETRAETTRDFLPRAETRRRGLLVQHKGSGANYESDSTLAEDLAGPVILGGKVNAAFLRLASRRGKRTSSRRRFEPRPHPERAQGSRKRHPEPLYARKPKLQHALRARRGNRRPGR